MSVNTDCSVDPAPVHGVVEFEPTAFRALYPQFTDPPVTDAMLTGYFQLATLILNNSCQSIVIDARKREWLLNLLVAHIATVTPNAANSGGGSGTTMVGPVSSATEGSVSIASGWAAQISQNAGWFMQSQFGALFWQATGFLRSFRYVAPAFCCGPAGAYPGRRGY